MTITPTLRNKNSDSLLPCIVCIVCFEEVAVGSRQKKILPCTVHLTISTPEAQSRSSVINKRCSGRLYGGPRRLWCHIFRISLTFFKLVFRVIGAPVNSSTPQCERKRIRPSFINFYRLQCSCIFGSGRRLCSSVVPWLPSLILWLRKIGECSIHWNRSLRAKTQGGVSEGQILYFL